MMTQRPKQAEHGNVLAGQSEEVVQLVWYMQTGSKKPSEVLRFIHGNADGDQNREPLVSRVKAILAMADAEGIGKKFREIIANLPECEAA
jgi:hypothetical protein